MRHLIAIRHTLAALASAVLLLSPAATAQEPARAPDPGADPLVIAVIEAHNAERAKEKLPPLKLAPLLEAAARAHATDMAGREVMTHDGADGSTPSQRISRAGYHFQTAGENVAKGYGSVSSVMQGWMDSPPHRQNIMGDFTEIGVAKVDGKDGKPYWCADFGKPIPKLDPAEATADLLRKINRDRTDAGLAALSADVTLARVAREQAAVLAKAKGEGGTPTSFEGLETRKYRELAMTTATGQPDPEAVHKMFLESPAHKERMLGPFSRVGIGYATAEDGVPSWCVILARPAAR